MATKTKPKQVSPKQRPAREAPKPTKKPTKTQDTGSAEVQIGFFTQRIEELVKHLKKHPKDFDSKRGLLMLVGKRRRLLNYLARKQPDRYSKLTTRLGLAKASR